MKLQLPFCNQCLHSCNCVLINVKKAKNTPDSVRSLQQSGDQQSTVEVCLCRKRLHFNHGLYHIKPVVPFLFVTHRHSIRQCRHMGFTILQPYLAYIQYLKCSWAGVKIVRGGSAWHIDINIFLKVIQLLQCVSEVVCSECFS